MGSLAGLALVFLKGEGIWKRWTLCEHYRSVTRRIARVIHCSVVPMKSAGEYAFIAPTPARCSCTSKREEGEGIYASEYTILYC